jgi:hypothetical protein
VSDFVEVSNQTPPDSWSHDGIYRRLIQQLPNWWGTDHEDVDLILEGYITTNTLNYEQFEYVYQQMRLQTMEGNNLDLFSLDYFGGTLPRRTGENDNSYRNRISATLLQEKATRYGMENALFLLTGIEPRIFEPWNPYDCGAYNVPSTLGYNIAGNYGSGSYPGEVFIDVYINAYQAMGNYPGYNTYGLGYNTAGWYGGDSLIKEIVTDQDVYQVVRITKPEGIKAWVRINKVIM